MTYNMTKTPPKKFMKNSQKLKTLFFSPPDITLHQIKRVLHKSEIMTYLYLPQSAMVILELKEILQDLNDKFLNTYF